jgi:hypothetical protein
VAQARDDPGEGGGEDVPLRFAMIGRWIHGVIRVLLEPVERWFSG